MDAEQLQHDLYLSEENLCLASEHIERLNQQVAMQEEALNILARLGNGDKYGNSDGNCIAIDALSNSPSKWLAAHDKQVRDVALEEAADWFEVAPEVNALRIAARLRSLKGD